MAPKLSLGGYAPEPGGKYRSGESDPEKVRRLIDTVRARQLPKEVQAYYTESLIRQRVEDVMKRAAV